MRYCLGVDIGNSAVTAAVADGAGVETVVLGRHSAKLPALVHVTPDGTILTGDEAVRATELQPTWTARMLSRRLDDPAPLQLGERTCEVTDLLSTVLWDVLDKVTTLRDGPPDHVVLDAPRRAGATRTGSAGRGRRPGGTAGRDDDHGPTRLRHLVCRRRTPRRPVRGVRLRCGRVRGRRPAGGRGGRRARRAARRRCASRRRRAGRAGARASRHPPQRRAHPVGPAHPRGGSHARPRPRRVRGREGDALDAARGRGDLAAAVGHPPDQAAPRGDRRALPPSRRGHRRGAAPGAGHRGHASRRSRPHGGLRADPAGHGLAPGDDRASRPHRARAGRGGGVGGGAARQPACGCGGARPGPGATARRPVRLVVGIAARHRRRPPALPAVAVSVVARRRGVRLRTRVAVRLCARVAVRLCARVAVRLWVRAMVRVAARAIVRALDGIAVCALVPVTVSAIAAARRPGARPSADPPSSGPAPQRRSACPSRRARRATPEPGRAAPCPRAGAGDRVRAGAARGGDRVRAHTRCPAHGPAADPPAPCRAARNGPAPGGPTSRCPTSRCPTSRCPTSRRPARRGQAARPTPGRCPPPPAPPPAAPAAAAWPPAPATPGAVPHTDPHPTDPGAGSASDGSDPTWRNPSIGRPLAVALALLAVIVAIAVILFVVLHRINGAAAGLVAPQTLVEAWWTYIGPRY